MKTDATPQYDHITYNIYYLRTAFHILESQSIESFLLLSLHYTSYNDAELQIISIALTCALAKKNHQIVFFSAPNMSFLS